MTSNEIKNVRYILIGLLIFLGFLYTQFSQTLEKTIMVYFILGAISLFFYYSKDFERNEIGISTKNLPRIFLFSLIFGVIFFVILKFKIGLSVLLPVEPGSVADNLTVLFTILIAPIAEEIFFRGGIMAFIRKFNPGKRGVWIAIIGSAILFSLFHFAIYTKLYDLGNLPDWSYVWNAFVSNYTLLILPFIFGIIAGWFVSQDGIKNLVFVIIIHFIWNFLNTALSIAPQLSIFAGLG